MQGRDISNKKEPLWKASCRTPMSPLHVISSCSKEDLRVFPKRQSPPLRSRKVVSGDHGPLLQPSQKDKNLKCLLDLAVSTLIPIPALWYLAYSSSSKFRSSVMPSPTPPPVLQLGSYDPSLKSLLPGAEGCGALRVKGKLTFILHAAVKQNWLAGLGRPHGI